MFSDNMRYNCEETLLCGMVKMQTTMPAVAADLLFNISNNAHTLQNVCLNFPLLCQFVLGCEWISSGLSKTHRSLNCTTLCIYISVFCYMFYSHILLVIQNIEIKNNWFWMAVPDIHFIGNFNKPFSAIICFCSVIIN